LTLMMVPCDSDRVRCCRASALTKLEGAMTFGAQGYALARGEGEGLWFFNGLFTVKAGGPDTREAFTLIEAELPAGEGPPPHIHHNDRLHHLCRVS